MRLTAPWPDFDGNVIREGDTIQHPTGERGVVVFIGDEYGADAWRVNYGDGVLSRLGLQIGDKGMATVVTRRRAAPDKPATRAADQPGGA